MKHAKHAILWYTPSTPFSEARQARKARHLADSLGVMVISDWLIFFTLAESMVL